MSGENTTPEMTKEQLDNYIDAEVQKNLEEGRVQREADQEAKVKALIASNAAAERLNDTKSDNPSGYANLAQFAHDVWKAGAKQERPDSLKTYLGGVKAKMAGLDARSKAAGAGMQEDVDEEGGFLVPEEFVADLMTVSLEKSDLMAKCTKIPVQRNSIRFPYISGFDHSSGNVYGGIALNWLEEEEAHTKKKPNLGKMSLRLKKVGGLMYGTDELIEDSPISIQPLFTELFTNALAWTMDWVIINGNGATQPQGILKAGALVSVAKEGGQSATTVVFKNVLKMYARQHNKNSCEWIANHDVLPQLAQMSVDVGTGGAAVWLPANSAAGRPHNTLFGRPINFSEHCQTLGTAGDIFCNDYSQYLLAHKSGANQGIKFGSSIHLKFDTDEVAFKIVFRVDGHSWWKAALTPRYSSDTLSPFVALAVRA